MPPKFRLFLDRIQDHLFYIKDNIVVLNRDEINKAGFSRDDLKLIFHFLTENGIIVDHNRWASPFFFRLPVDHGVKKKRMKGTGWILLPEKLITEQVYVELTSRDAFFAFYKNPSGPKEIPSADQPSFKVGIFYNDKTGMGWANGKEFKFKDHQPEFAVFGRLYAQIGEPVGRKEVLNLAHRTEGPMATLFINDLVKEMRRRTGLMLHELALNNGNITLVGIKLDEFPK